MIQVTENYIHSRSLQFFVPDDLNQPQIFRIASASRSVELAIPPNHGPPRGGLLLAQNLGNVANRSLCDLGTGPFALNPIVAKLSGARCAVGIEADPNASNWANKSIQTAGLKDVAIITAGDLSGVDEKFDTIVGNLPIMPTYKDRPENIYVYGGVTGWEVVNNYLQQITNHLNKEGIVRLLLFEFMGIEKRTSDAIPSAFERFSEIGLAPRIVAKHNFPLNENHPLRNDIQLESHVRNMYDGYVFDKGLTKVIVEGSLK